LLLRLCLFVGPINTQRKDGKTAISYILSPIQ
jgi:hypothetical protein